ncbi:MAG: hypothetical protein U1B78_01595, partial [Dehalococcoidia bacterium]|nr:hypothetical protein [Dehalococcoidia bacterium]
MRRAVLPLLAVVLLTACGLAKDEDASAPTLAAARQARTPVLLPTLRLRSGHADGSVSATAQPTL